MGKEYVFIARSPDFSYYDRTYLFMFFNAINNENKLRPGLLFSLRSKSLEHDGTKPLYNTAKLLRQELDNS